MKKNICFVSPKFSSHIGGMETHAYEFARAFVGHPDFPISRILIKENVTDGISAPNKCLYGPEQKQTAKDLKWHITKSLTGDFQKDAITILAGQNPENTIFYLNSPTWLPSLVIIKQNYPKTRIIVRSGGNDIVAGWIGNEIDVTSNLEDSRIKLVDMINKYVDYFVVNSQYSYNRTAAVGVAPNKLVKVIGGVDCARFYPSTKSSISVVNVLTAARLVKFKGFEYSLEVIEQAKARGYVFKYTIIGDGPERANIEHIIAEKGLDNVNLLGAQRIEDMPNYFRAADIFLHMPIYLEKRERGSSYIHTETMGRCLCEASASGLPIIASCLGGIPEIVLDGETGFLVREKDYVAATDRLVELIQNRAKRQVIGQKGRMRAETFFDWSIIFKEYRGLFA